VQVEDVTGEPKLDSKSEEDVHQEASPSTTTEKRKGKQPMHRSSCKQEEIPITLPHIPEGVKIFPKILECIEKMRYADHDVAERDKFPEFEL
jgi:hypothetical protein